MSHSEHPAMEALEDHVDGVISPREHDAVAVHLSLCSECQAILARLERLRANASKLPRVVLPPTDLWPVVRAEIERRKDAVLPVTDRGAYAAETRSGAPWRHEWVRLAAAALMLVAVSSGITAVLMQRANGAAATRAANGSRVNDPRSVAVLPASFVRTESEYRKTIDDLHATFESQREHLSPETVRTVEHSLAVIDSAIIEARAALLADPGNQTIGELLVSSYQRKLDLLRRSSELTSRI